MNSTYSVSPNYSGIWPIKPALFNIWSKEFSIKTTSTENYLDVNNLTRGFIYNNIMVAPRQPSIIFKKGLQSNSSRNNDLPIWFSNNDKEVCQFETILTNNVLIFNSNFDHNIYQYSDSFYFISNWTNLKFYSLPPDEIVKKYFELNPKEKEPLWMVRKLV